MIPKKFHRIWFGARQRPEQYDMYWDMWKVLHPDWEFHTWTEENLPSLINQFAYDRVEETAKSCGIQMSHERAVAVMRADIVAYELVYRYGGVYLNCDMYPLKTFELLRDSKAFLGMEDEYHVCNAVMGGEPDHPLYGTTIRNLNQSLLMYDSIGMEVATGPQHLTRVWRGGNYDVTILPREAFYPVHHGAVPYGETDFETMTGLGRDADAYAVHMWGHRSQEGKLFE